MDTSAEERLSGPVADEEGLGQTDVPSSPQASATSRRSSTSSSPGSSHSSHKSEVRQRTTQCRKHCSTVLACLLVGVMITVGSVAMTVCGYFAMNIASSTVQSENSTSMVLDEQLHENLDKFRTFGPVMIGFGSFLIMCACVLLCEEKDKKHKSRTQASENLLSEHERIMQRARERFYNENQNALVVESQTVDLRTTKASSNELTSCLDSDVGNRVLTQVEPLTRAPESDNASGTSGSPVVLVHGPTIVEPSPDTEDKTRYTNENEVRHNSPSHSNQSSPERQFGSPSHLKKNNSVRPSSIEDLGSGLTRPVLPKIDYPRSSNGISRAGGAIPKSILVQPIKLSPIRSVNGPIRIRLDDSSTELSPFGPSDTSKSAEFLPQPRSPGRVKRGKKKKSPNSLQAGSFGQCRCLSDPSMSSMRSADRQLDSCCCLQPDCCWGGNCQLDRSIPSSSTSKSVTDDPLSVLVATGGKANSPLPPLNTCTNVNAQSIEMKSKSSGELVAAAPNDRGSNKQETTLHDTHLNQQNSDNKLTNDERDIVKDTPTPKGEPSPTRQVSNTGECSAEGGEGTTTEGTNTEKLAVKDRNSNIKVSSRRQDTPGKSAPYSGPAKSGVLV